MKKLFAILIACTTLISCVSCSSDSKETDPESGAKTTVAGTTAGDNGTTAPDDDTTAGGNSTTTVPNDGTTAPDDSTGDVQTDAPSEKSKVLYSWAFDDEDESLDYWTQSENIISCEIEDKVLNVTLDETDIDPTLLSESILDDVFTEDIKTITLRVKNCTSDTLGAIYYVTENMQYCESDALFKFTYKNSGENADWEIVTINVAEVADELPKWEGLLSKIRFDPINNPSGGNFYVDYISING